MPIPQPVLDGLNNLQADREAYDAANTAKAIADTALATAQHTADQANTDVTNSLNKLNQDEAAFETLVKATFLPAPVVL